MTETTQEYRDLLRAHLQSTGETSHIVDVKDELLSLLNDADRLALSDYVGEVVVTTNERGDAVAVTRQDEEGEILSVIWERGGEPAVPEAVRRLPGEWRATAQCVQDQRFGKAASAEIRRLHQCADELDRAIARHGEE